MITFYKGTQLIKVDTTNEIVMGYYKDAGYLYYTDDNIPSELQEALEQERLATELANQEAEAKRLKQEALATITVEVNGKVFDGNETARNNMLASIQASQLLGIESNQWKLADNTIQLVTLDELKEALTLSIQAVGTIVLVGATA